MKGVRHDKFRVDGPSYARVMMSEVRMGDMGYGV